MDAVSQALGLLSQIDDATNKQAAALAAESATLTTISGEIDTLLAGAQASGVPQTVLDGLAAQVAKVNAVSAALDLQAQFSAAIASKGASDPVPVPVPSPSAG